MLGGLVISRFILIFSGLFFFFLILKRYMFFSQPFGEYQISPFALKTAIGSWKIDDPYSLEHPSSLTAKYPIKVKLISKITGRVIKEEILKLDFKNIAKEMIVSSLDKIFYDMPNFTVESRKIITDFLTEFFIKDVELSVHRVVSARNNLVIFWIAASQPAQYGISRTKPFYKKWNVVPTYAWRGMPEIEAFAKKMRFEVIVSEDYSFPAIIAFPYFDESFRKYRSLVLLKYANMADSVFSMAKDFGTALISLDYMNITEKKNERLETQRKQLMVALDEAHSDMSDLTTRYGEMLSQLSTVSGIANANPSLPIEIKDILKRILMESTEKKSFGEKAVGKLSEVKSFLNKEISEEKPLLVSNEQQQSGA
jgi:hypothetical protein